MERDSHIFFSRIFQIPRRKNPYINQVNRCFNFLPKSVVSEQSLKRIRTLRIETDPVVVRWGLTKAKKGNEGINIFDVGGIKGTTIVYNMLINKCFAHL